MNSIDRAAREAALEAAWQEIRAATWAAAKQSVPRHETAATSYSRWNPTYDPAWNINTKTPKGD